MIGVIVTHHTMVHLTKIRHTDKILVKWTAVIHLLFSHIGYAGAPPDDFSPQQLRHFLVLLYSTLQDHYGMFSGLLIAWWCCILFMQVILCKPVETFWVQAESKHCFDRLKMNQATSISSVTWDVTLLLLPLPMIWEVPATRLYEYIRRKAILITLISEGTAIR
ncbi:hypothetical protein GGR53DRAFT_359608 [Hypoxylon sp. FL1150]|nr:hypothetical protein GGR53DRAFT_359608 [Hypoxylon sp. FL1150]